MNFRLVKLKPPAILNYFIFRKINPKCWKSQSIASYFLELNEPKGMISPSETHLIHLFFHSSIHSLQGPIIYQTAQPGNNYYGMINVLIEVWMMYREGFGWLPAEFRQSFCQKVTYLNHVLKNKEDFSSRTTWKENIEQKEMAFSKLLKWKTANK